MRSKRLRHASAWPPRHWGPRPATWWISCGPTPRCGNRPTCSAPGLDISRWWDKAYSATAARPYKRKGFMARPSSFTWIDKPWLGAMARPESREELVWLRSQGIDVLLSLTEEPPRRDWVNDAGMMVVHVPVEDMQAPTPEQLDQAVTGILRANEHQMGVAVHCGAGLGRTGVILACYLVHQGLSAGNAMARVRQLRPGSIETDEQVEAVEEF